MTISLSDYLIILKDLMKVVGFSDSQIEYNIANWAKGILRLKDLSANIAVQCFMKECSNVGTDLVRAYLKEYSKNQEAVFSEHHEE